MKAKDLQPQTLSKKIVSLLVMASALLIAAYTVYRYDTRPLTDDASIDAEVVHVAAEVAGRIVKMAVVENAVVKRNDLLFQIDPEPYQLAVDQARANLALAQADLVTRQKLLFTQRTNASVAKKQAHRAVINLSFAERSVNRLQPLQTQGYVPLQQLDQALTNKRNAQTALRQAHEQAESAEVSVDTIDSAVATVRAQEAALANSLRNLRKTSVLAMHDGRIVGLTVSSGEMVAVAQPIFTLINTEEWHAEANFRETDLKNISVGDCATVYSMVNRSQSIKGIVQGIGSGVKNSDSSYSPSGLPSVESSLNWVRVAQRFPVRVVLKNPPPDLMRMGASAVVEIKESDVCP